MPASTAATRPDCRISLFRALNRLTWETLFGDLDDDEAEVLARLLTAHMWAID